MNDRWLRAATSSLAKFYYQLDPAAKRRLGLSGEVVLFWDNLVTVCGIMVDDGGPSLAGRIEQLDRYLNRVDDPSGVPDLTELADSLRQKADSMVPPWVFHIRAPETRRYLNQLCGEGPYHGLMSALQSDIQVVTSAMRQFLRAARPYVTAVGDSLMFAKESDRPAVLKLNPTASTLLSFVMRIDRALSQLDDLFEWGTDQRVARLPPPDLTQARLADMIDQCRATIAGRSRSPVNRLGDILQRKLAGAEHALLGSPDGVSQAAGSLVELIDRLVRLAFTDDEVLDWLTEHNVRADRYTYPSKETNKIRPTKRAQLLCLIWARGTPSAELLPWTEMLAAAVVASRGELEQLKHADSASPAELRKVEQSLFAIRAFTVILCELLWRLWPETEVLSVTARLSNRVLDGAA